jgi:dihydrofolate synthase/folylpolyglutamate synthase
MPESARETVARFASLDGCRFTAADEHVEVESIAPLVVTTPSRNPPPMALALEGAFQVENAMTALTALDVLCRDCGFYVSDMAVRAGFEKAVWPGRFQKVVYDGVVFVVDGAHNPDGAAALANVLRMGGVARPIGLVAGFCGDKDVDGHLRTMAPLVSRAWAVPIRNDRSLPSDAVADRMRSAGIAEAEACAALADALSAAGRWARATGGTAVACGSLFLAGEALVELGAYPWPIRAPDPNESLSSLSTCAMSGKGI